MRVIGERGRESQRGDRDREVERDGEGEGERERERERELEGGEKERERERALEKERGRERGGLRETEREREMSQSIAAESVAEFPVLPTWPGIQIKATILSSLGNYTCSSKISLLERASERGRECSVSRITPKPLLPSSTCQNSVRIIPQNKREK